MSPILRRPAPKKPAARKAVKTVLKKPAGAVRTGAKRPVQKAVVKKAPPVKRTLAKAGRPAPARLAKGTRTVTPVGEAARQLKARQSGLIGKTNQDMINVIYKAADELKMPAWTLLATVKLEKLVDARSAPYAGPAVADMPGLTSDQKAVIQKILSSYSRK